MTTFTILMPSYNRADLIGRAIDSVLAQDDGDFEIIVIDSASTDGSRELVRAYAARDPRVRLICEETRRGVCPARNVGIDHATGEWAIPIDTDDEMPPGTLSRIRRDIAADPAADHHRYLCRWDDGYVSPEPPFGEEQWGYEEYLRFLDRYAHGGRGETGSCTRMTTFREVRYPESRAYETIYHLDFARRFTTRTHPFVARLYHTDADDQNSFAPNPRHWLRAASDVASSMDEILERHGGALERIAPTAWARMLRTTAKFNFMAGRRRRGAALALRLWHRHPLDVMSWIIFVFGILGPRPLAWADSLRFRVHRRRVRK